MSTEQTVGLVVGGVVTLGGLVLAAAASPGPGAPLPGTAWMGRASVLGCEATVASLLWTRAVQRFGRAASNPDPGALTSAGSHVREDLIAVTTLDPSLDDAWLGGWLMLRVTGDAAHARAFADAGHAARPDLPWHLLEAP